MKLKNILGNRDFSSQRKIRDTVKTSVNYADENIDIAELFYFFSTQRQRTWFVATDKKAYIILDDVRKESVKVNRSYNIKNLYSGTKLNIKIDTSYKNKYGRVFFQSSTRGWLYSKNLYPLHQELHKKFLSIINQAAG